MRGRLAIIGLVVCAMTGCSSPGLPFGGGASAPFPSPISRPLSKDDLAKGLLLSAVGGAMAISFDPGGAGFADVTVEKLHEFDPSMHVVGDVPAQVGVVSLNHAGADGAVLSTRSPTGHVFCIALEKQAGTPTTGTVDAQGATSVSDCGGKPWSLMF